MAIHPSVPMVTGADYAMVRLFRARLNCFPMRDEKAADAALTLPISLPLLKSWAPCSVMFSAGFPYPPASPIGRIELSRA
jgi:hypothetical protein